MKMRYTAFAALLAPLFIAALPEQAAACSQVSVEVDGTVNEMSVETSGSCNQTDARQTGHGNALYHTTHGANVDTTITQFGTGSYLDSSTSGVNRRVHIFAGPCASGRPIDSYGRNDTKVIVASCR